MQPLRKPNLFWQRMLDFHIIKQEAKWLFFFHVLYVYSQALFISICINISKNFFDIEIEIISKYLFACFHLASLKNYTAMTS